MSNYPDDIRNYDHDPRSPFYDGPDDDQDPIYCEECGEEMEFDDGLNKEICPFCDKDANIDDENGKDA